MVVPVVDQRVGRFEAADQQQAGEGKQQRRPQQQGGPGRQQSTQAPARALEHARRLRYDEIARRIEVAPASERPKKAGKKKG